MAAGDGRNAQKGVAGAKPQRSVNYENEVLQGNFLRHNPQFKNGGYVTERKIEAVSLPSARKRAREISEHCVYGSMELLDIEMEA